MYGFNAGWEYYWNMCLAHAFSLEILSFCLQLCLGGVPLRRCLLFCLDSLMQQAWVPCGLKYKSRGMPSPMPWRASVRRCLRLSVKTYKKRCGFNAGWKRNLRECLPLWGQNTSVKVWVQCGLKKTRTWNAFSYGLKVKKSFYCLGFRLLCQKPLGSFYSGEPAYVAALCSLKVVMASEFIDLLQRTIAFLVSTCILSPNWIVLY